MSSKEKAEVLSLILWLIGFGMCISAFFTHNIAGAISGSGIFFTITIANLKLTMGGGDKL